MPPSTMSITASLAASTRRRPLIAGENIKSNIELVNDGVISPIVHKFDVRGGDEKITGVSNNNLIYSIRGEKFLERSKDTVQIKKTLQPSSNASPRRARKSTSPKPLWQRILSVLTKNLLLLFVLVGFVQMVRKLVINLGSDGLVLAEFSDMESRIAKVESSFKKTTKMLQVQLKAVEKKTDGELSILRNEMNKKLKEENEDIDSRLRTLDERKASMEKTLGRLTSKDLLSKEDFAKFYEELRKSYNGDSGQSDLSLDEIKKLARQIVENEIEKHSADGLGMIDYALGTAGGMVVKHSDPYTVGKGGDWFSLTNRRQGIHYDAEKMLKPSFGEPGQCFPLKGNNGFVQIKLRTAIIPEAITLEHVSKSVAYDRSSAPRDCQVYGWLQGAIDTEIAVEAEKTLLTEFSYDLEKSNAQTFNVVDSASSAVVDTIRFDFTSNHGSGSHTCIYRVRVHGREPKSLSHLDFVSH